MVDIANSTDGQCSPRKKLMQAQLRDRELREEDKESTSDLPGAKGSKDNDDMDKDEVVPVLNQKPSFGTTVLSTHEQIQLHISLPNHAGATPRLARKVSENYIRGVLGEAQAKATVRESQEACK
ncbi:hypothetical protein H257_17973 [Aphanomyces astaci]|uniref:Uncharacterized protein n=1 Tax=Aphanomyces astaci TaxID=112090 RepID=W4FEV3_APHAT|nr:hypothetical protein H257_17973 [Aphanomyces astaci]ETV65253.1 hypothetical protein H257_17973 [Aphanomyces astaci]|eukprot:XP_009845254.1 hypothetical protein H257_17973 [Aphanomyces astaci]